MAELARRAAAATSGAAADHPSGAGAPGAGTTRNGTPGGSTGSEGEVCEIVGFGPVAVSAVRDILDSGNAFLAAVITKGEQVLGAVHFGRRPPAAVRTALQWDQPRCANEACPRMARLEYDHEKDWAATHVTLFDHLGRLCDHDHDLKTRKGWSLVEGHGRRAFVPPDDPRHPRNKAGGGEAAARPPPAADNDPPEAA